jgi:hypothetical protein
MALDSGVGDVVPDDWYQAHELSFTSTQGIAWALGMMYTMEQSRIDTKGLGGTPAALKLEDVAATVRTVVTTTFSKYRVHWSPTSRFDVPYARPKIKVRHYHCNLRSLTNLLTKASHPLDRFLKEQEWADRVLKVADSTQSKAKETVPQASHQNTPYQATGAGDARGGENDWETVEKPGKSGEETVEESWVDLGSKKAVTDQEATDSPDIRKK